MRTSPRSRPSSKFLALASLVLVAAGCAPTLDVGCKDDRDCAALQSCVAGTCRAAVADGEPGGAGGALAMDATAEGGRAAPSDVGMRPDALVTTDGHTGRDAFVQTEAGKPQPDTDAAPVNDAGPLQPDAAAPCPLPPGAPVPAETCNGLDDDCDGLTDLDAEGLPLVRVCYSGAPETRGVGVCQTGIEQCERADWGECRHEVVPTAEVCDGLDNDCNRVIDEGAEGGPIARACYSGAPETAGVGPCHFGAQICFDGVMGPCMGESPPAVEICDGADNDCSGIVDDVPDGGADACGDCEAGEVRGCYPGLEGTAGVGQCVAGTQACGGDHPGWGACEGALVPAVETCDGQDNDCDGVIDESIPGVDEACRAGTGLCTSMGTRICDGRQVRCDAPAVAPGVEACNGQDDDCNGVSDEDFPLGSACESGVGACNASGVVVCQGGGAVCDATPAAPGEEDCNGVDDDCDGVIDEPDTGADVLQRACYSGGAGTSGTGPCHGGRQRCEPVGAGQWSSCLDETVPVGEVCDGVDNDCDGMPDDGLGGQCACVPGSSRICYNGPDDTEGVGLCRAGMQACEGGSYGPCVGEVQPGPELCNDADDDCNGEDDDVVGLGDPCESGVGACARPGELDCDRDAEALVCTARTGAPSAERCNGYDDDCDGRTDEGTGFGDPCSAGVGGCARAGRLRCDDDEGVTCDATPGQPAGERCDGIDNDCNGEPDNGGAAGSCAAVPSATATCEDGGCVYRCGARAYDSDGNPANGCERGCGAITAGQRIADLALFTGEMAYSGDLAVASDNTGLGGVAYVQASPLNFRTSLVLYSGQSMTVSPNTGGGHGPPGLAVANNRWVTFSQHSTGVPALASDSRLDGSTARFVLPMNELRMQNWPRQGDVIPGVAGLRIENDLIGVAFTVAPAAVGSATGRLQTRVMNATDGSRLNDGLIGNDGDYVATSDSRMLGFATGPASAVLALTQGADADIRLRFVMIDRFGAIAGRCDSPDALPSVSRDLAAAFSGNVAFIAFAESVGGRLRLWRLEINNNTPVMVAIDPNVVGVASVAVAWGGGGPIVFFRQEGLIRALFLDFQGRTVGGPLDVVQASAPGMGDVLRQFRATVAGNRIYAAWVASIGGTEQLRQANLDCR